MGDIVLLRDTHAHCIDWPLGYITHTYASDDGKVRKVNIRVCKEGKVTTYVRPINEVVLLVRNEETVE